MRHEQVPLNDYKIGSVTDGIDNHQTPSARTQSAGGNRSRSLATSQIMEIENREQGMLAHIPFGFRYDILWTASITEARQTLHSKSKTDNTKPATGAQILQGLLVEGQRDRALL